MKIALVTDTHWGVRADNTAFHKYFEKFYSEVFFPYLKENDIHDIVHLGDIVDRRKFINFASARALRKQFIEPCMREYNTHIIIGNHDTYFKNTNAYNAIEELYWLNTNDNFKWYDRATEVMFGECKILFIPWICSDNKRDTLDLINSTDATVAFGHLELNGFSMYRGHVAMEGDDPKIFQKFETVCSGHFHTRSTSGNITYLGSPCEYTWSDYNDPKGFHVFDTETRELTFIENPISIFKKINYDDAGLTYEDILGFNFDDYTHTIVKVLVSNKENPYWFDLFIEKLENAGVIDLQIIDDNLNFELDGADDIISEGEDTLDIFRSHIQNLEIKSIDTKKLELLITELYHEALNIE